MFSIILIIGFSLFSLIGINEFVIRSSAREPSYKPIYYKKTEYNLLYILPFIILLLAHTDSINLVEMILFILTESISFHQFDLFTRLIGHSGINILRACQYYQKIEILPNMIICIPIFYLISHLDEKLINKYEFFAKLRIYRLHYLYLSSLVIMYFYSLCFLILGYISFFLSISLSLILFILVNIFLNFEKLDFLKSNLLLNKLITTLTGINNGVKNLKIYIFFTVIVFDWVLLVTRILESHNLNSIISQ